MPATFTLPPREATINYPVIPVRGGRKVLA